MKSRSGSTPGFRASSVSMSSPKRSEIPESVSPLRTTYVVGAGPLSKPRVTLSGTRICWPTKMSFGESISSFSASRTLTSVPKSAAMPESVSPDCTVYESALAGAANHSAAQTATATANSAAVRRCGIRAWRIVMLTLEST